LVLALCGRGVAGLVHLGVLALRDSVQDKGRFCGPFVSRFKPALREYRWAESNPFSKTAKC